jgi:hypothetical protein
LRLSRHSWGEDVKLKGDELENMRIHTTTAERHLLAVGNRVLKLLGVRSKAIKAIVLLPNNSKVLVLDGDFNLVGVEEDPPGVCRRPTEKEVSDWG